MNSGKVDYKQLVTEYGSPCFFFDEDILVKRMSSIRSIVDKCISLCYAIKANPFLISSMKPLVDRFEVCSPGELDICRSMSVDPETILLSGVNKTTEDITEALVYGVRNFTAESILHAEILESCASKFDVNVSCLLRLSSGSQFGMSEADIRTLLSNRTAYPHISFEGIHYFVGTQRKRIQQHVQELEMLKSLLTTLRHETGLPLRKLEYGPGLPVPLFCNEDFSDTLSPLKELAPSLKDTIDWADLTIEMGRFFVTECGSYITRVMDLKEITGVNYAILDGGINHVNYYGSMMGMKTPVLEHLHSSNNSRISSLKDWCLCGSLCTTSDFLVRDITLDSLEIGDYIIFHNIGAYSVTEGLYLFLSRMMPRILLKKGENVLVLRDFYKTSVINTAII